MNSFLFQGSINTARSNFPTPPRSFRPDQFSHFPTKNCLRFCSFNVEGLSHRLLDQEFTQVI